MQFDNIEFVIEFSGKKLLIQAAVEVTSAYDADDAEVEVLETHVSMADDSDEVNILDTMTPGQLAVINGRIVDVALEMFDEAFNMRLPGF